ncbi:hypothetical protein Dsin_015070 [Dipteronia sinensis]|uniref:ATP-dependent DNA helicase n=1 Tax=Dipteronia sinensis TaxID=43782 RepID=A0AAE0AP24_9ROSI|nr:hypothetical protein Dsin_015070 [Dipteronia sinensis]
MLQDVNDNELQFGGKVIVFGGDFRQILPVVLKATREETINASLVNSYLWPMLEKIRLTENMRAKFDPLFSQFLLRIGNGTEETDADEKIKLPAMMTIPYDDNETFLNTLLDIVFPNIHDYSNNINFMINRAILTPTNDYVDEINNLLIHKFPGYAMKCYSFDETLDKTKQGFQEDFLNTLTPNGLFPHELVLKPGCPIMLHRNISPSEALCNGTRLICNQFESNVIDAEIAIGHYHGKIVFLPRIPFLPMENDKYPFPFKRTKFPIPLSFAMTIKKSQGQTFDYVGIYLPQPAHLLATKASSSFIINPDTSVAIELHSWSILNESILEDIIKNKSYMTFVSSFAPAFIKDVQIDKIETLLTKIN